ncbi:hypothetical protein BJ170DRAFT_646755 [Xylariales sp. AK1849]|nr:hypothetical protein BJ170DRAFT_646755 [Xylariales sp. AK1849]
MDGRLSGHIPERLCSRSTSPDTQHEFTAHRSPSPFRCNPYRSTDQMTGTQPNAGVPCCSDVPSHSNSTQVVSETCSVDKRTLLQLIEKALRFSCQDEIPWESLLDGRPTSSTRQKSAAMLKVSLWALRDYAMGMRSPEDGEGEEPSNAMGQSIYSWNNGRTTDGLSVFHHEHNHLDDQSPLSRKVSTNHMKPSVRNLTGPNGHRRRRKAWTSHDEQRLKECVDGEQNWHEIATSLNRSAGAVEQHWRLMTLQERKSSPGKYRFRRTS